MLPGARINCQELQQLPGADMHSQEVTGVERSGKKLTGIGKSLPELAEVT